MLHSRIGSKRIRQHKNRGQIPINSPIGLQPLRGKREQLLFLMRRRQHAARVHQAQGVEGVFERVHQL